MSCAGHVIRWLSIFIPHLSLLLFSISHISMFLSSLSSGVSNRKYTNQRNVTRSEHIWNVLKPGKFKMRDYDNTKSVWSNNGIYRRHIKWIIAKMKQSRPSSSNYRTTDTLHSNFWLCQKTWAEKSPNNFLLVLKML